MRRDAYIFPIRPYKARLKQLDIASISMRDVSAVVQDIGGSGMTGLLGMNVLGGYKMTVDHEHNLLLMEKR